mmetsp:Transcript_118725/g.335846  ORF Transcript_118725/g.335846 Transcript_118725/m.335846 type:complete len:516 (+) Transcript_118725:127-1674(+)
MGAHSAFHASDVWQTNGASPLDPTRCAPRHRCGAVPSILLQDQETGVATLARSLVSRRPVAFRAPRRTQDVAAALVASVVSAAAGATRCGRLGRAQGLHARVMLRVERAEPAVTINADENSWRTLRAQRAMAAGEVLVREAPILVWRRGSTPEENAQNAIDSFAALPTSAQQRALSFYCPMVMPPGLVGLEVAALATERERRLLWILEVCGTGVDDISAGLFAHVACANHSCRPNAALRPDVDGKMRFLALRPVAAGDEVTISYVSDDDLLRPTNWRRCRLRAWGFECHCERCVAPDDTRGLRCPRCNVGVVRAVMRGFWSRCDACSMPADARLMQRSEASWWRRRRALKQSEVPAALSARMRRYALGLGPKDFYADRGRRLCRLGWLEATVEMHQKVMHELTAAGDCTATHWFAALVAADAAEAHLWRGAWAEAAVAARTWRSFLRQALGGALAHEAAMATATEAAAVACAGDKEAAAKLYHAALQEAAPLQNDWDAGDILVPHLRKQLYQLEQ